MEWISRLNDVDSYLPHRNTRLWVILGVICRRNLSPFSGGRFVGGPARVARRSCPNPHLPKVSRSGGWRLRCRVGQRGTAGEFFSPLLFVLGRWQEKAQGRLWEGRLTGRREGDLDVSPTRRTSTRGPMNVLCLRQCA